MNEDDFDENGIRWECQGCADKFGLSKEEYREWTSNKNCEFCECEKTLEQLNNN